MAREDKQKLNIKATGISRFKAKPITDLDKAMVQVRKIMKKNQKTLEILKH